MAPFGASVTVKIDCLGFCNNCIDWFTDERMVDAYATLVLRRRQHVLADEAWCKQYGTYLHLPLVV